LNIYLYLYREAYVIIINYIRNAEIVISEWIETAKTLGREIPTPKGKLIYA
jgi:hypothetical protein